MGCEQNAGTICWQHVRRLSEYETSVPGMEVDMSEISFDGQVLVVYLRTPGKSWNHGAAIKNPRIITIAGRSFLSGISITASATHWASGQHYHFPVEDVEVIIEFATEEAYSKRPRTRRRFFSRLLRSLK